MKDSGKWTKPRPRWDLHGTQCGLWGFHFGIGIGLLMGIPDGDPNHRGTNVGVSATFGTPVYCVETKAAATEMDPWLSGQRNREWSWPETYS